MKKYTTNILQFLFSKYPLLGLGLAALITATLALTFGFYKVINQLQNNDFGLWGDVLIFYLGYIGIALITWAKFTFAYWLGLASGHVIVAGATAMTFASVMSAGSFVVLVGYGATRNPLPQKSFYPQVLSSPSLWFNRQDRDFPVAKLTSRSKIPYQLFPVSCILLN